MIRVYLPLLLALFPLFASAQTPTPGPTYYFVMPTTGVGLGPTQLAAVSELIVIAVGTTEGARTTKDEKAAQAVLEPKVINLGSAYILSITKLRDGKAIFQQQARAATFEDMDTVAGRVARAVINEVRFKQDTQVSDVTEDETTRGKRRIETVEQFYLGLGGATTTSLNTSNSGIYGTAGHTWAIDDHWSVDLALAFMLINDANAGWSDGHLDASYHFTERSISPYLFGSFGYGAAKAASTTGNRLADETAAGLVYGGGGGVKLFRASTVNLGLSLRYMVMQDTTSQGNPATASFVVTLFTP